jgi:ferric-dicitrate binding protein FerR (iron transport regulator)
MTPDDLEREARKVLEPLRYSPIGMASARRVEAGRHELVPHLERIIEAVPQARAARQTRQRRWHRARSALAGSFVLAAAGLVWLGATRLSPMASSHAEPAQLELVSGQVSQKGSLLHSGVKYAIDSLGRLSTPTTSGARFVTDTGVALEFGAGSTADLSFTPNRQQIALNRGKVELSVPKLTAGTSLSVATPDAVVTVHGTRFSVEVMSGQTCVKVSEGVVSVARAEARERLTRGQSSGCTPLLAPSSSERAAEALVTTRAAGPLANTPAEAEARSKPKSSGTLLQENRLFQSALRAEQSGDRARAELLATQLLTRYPDSVMAADARRLLGRMRTARSGTHQAP